MGISLILGPCIVKVTLWCPRYFSSPQPTRNKASRMKDHWKILPPVQIKSFKVSVVQGGTRSLSWGKVGRTHGFSLRR